MVVNLDKIDYDRADPGKMQDHLANFVDYLKDAWDIANEFALPSYFIKCRKILIVGMGASGIAGEFIKDLATGASVLVEVSHDYILPTWASSDTLVIAISHSGDTEEVLYSFVSAYQQGAKLLAISTGGKLAGLCRKFKSPIIKYNFDSEPKLAFPYLLLILFVVLKKLGCFSFGSDDFKIILDSLSTQIDKISPEIHTAVNPAKDLAKKLYNYFVYIISSGNLRSAGIRFSNAINENSKALAAYSFLPEVNHNFVAGLEQPKEIIRKILIVILESKFTHGEIKKQENIIAKFLQDKRVNYFRLNFPQAKNQLMEILLAVSFIEYTTMYLAFLNDVDPVSAKAVNQIKLKLL